MARLEQLVDHHGQPGRNAPLPSVRFDDVDGDPSSDLPLERAIEPWDIQSIIYTSGTTGPSKGVLSSYLHMFSNAGPESWPMVGEDDRYMCVAPIFHIGGMGPPFVMLARGASVALIDNFSTDEFWSVAKRTGATVVFLLGVMATFLLKAQPSPQDRDHCVKKAFMVPLTGDARRLQRTFRHRHLHHLQHDRDVVAGRVRSQPDRRSAPAARSAPGVDVRLVDGNDCEVRGRRNRRDAGAHRPPLGDEQRL